LEDPEGWDAVVTASSIVSTPPQLIVLSPSWALGANDDYVADMLMNIETADSVEESQKLWDELQLYAWEELLPVIQLGGFNDLFAYSNKLEGFIGLTGPVFWNAKFVE